MDGTNEPETGMPAALRRYGREITVREGRAFQYQDDPCEACCYILRGTVRPVKFASDGKPFDLPPLTAGRWFGLAELLSGNTSLFDAVAAEECRALSFTRINLELALREPAASRTILSALAAEIVWTHRILADEDALGKLLTYLLSHRNGTVNGMERSCIRRTQTAVAEAVGLTRETVNRQLKELEARGVLTTARGEIAIPDWAKLEAFADGRNR